MATDSVERLFDTASTLHREGPSARVPRVAHEWTPFDIQARFADVIGLVEVISIGYFGADFVDIAVYGLLLLILFIRPTGLFAGSLGGQARI